MYHKGDKLRIIDAIHCMDDEDPEKVEKTVPAGTLIKVTDCVENLEEYTIVFWFEGVEFMAPSYFFGPPES